MWLTTSNRKYRNIPGSTIKIPNHVTLSNTMPQHFQREVPCNYAQHRHAQLLVDSLITWHPCYEDRFALRSRLQTSYDGMLFVIAPRRVLPLASSRWIGKSLLGTECVGARIKCRYYGVSSKECGRVKGGCLLLRWLILYSCNLTVCSTGIVVSIVPSMLV